ncbi:MAG: proton-conducting transporter membrane subunit [bacterium]
MVFSGGFILFALVLLVFFLPRSFLKWYAPFCMAIVALYGWFISPAGVMGFDFFGFDLQLYEYREYSRLIASAMALFAFCYYLYIFPRNKNRVFYFFTLTHVAAALAILFVNDFMSFFILWETLTITAAALIFIENCPSKLIVKYFIYQLAGTISLLAGIAICYSSSGSLVLEPVAGAYPFFILAVLIKAAVIPFHIWLPATYPKVSFDLSVFFTAFVTKVGVFSVWLLTGGVNFELLGGIVALVAVLYAIKQQHLRSFLSYHIISQVGYILAGLSSASLLATSGGTYHLVNNIIYKGLLFMIVVVIARELGSENIESTGGLALTKKYPFLFVAALVASASITGLPPFNGFISKKIILEGIENELAANLLFLASIGTGFSFTKFLYFSFLQPGQLEFGKKLSFAPLQKFAVFILTAACILLGLFPGLLISQTAASELDFYNRFAVSRGLLPGLIAVFIFVVSYRKTADLIDFFMPDWSKNSFWPAKTAGKILDILQNLHSGSLQRYIAWIFSTMLVLWFYLLNNGNIFKPLLFSTKKYLLLLLGAAG